MKKIYFLTAFLFLVFYSQPLSSQDKESFKNKTWGFKIEYPAGWDRISKNLDSGFVFMSGKDIAVNRKVAISIIVMQSASFKDKSLDTIIISDVLEHISDPCKLWSEMSRILSPGGHIIGNSPFLYWIHEAPFDYHRMTPSAIELYIKTAGLELISVESLGSILDTWTDVTAKALSLMPGLREFGQVGIQALTSPFR